ncbi:sulfur oxidation c-type cytochrome SoxA [Hydrogenothermus marinus]|uniref:SoxAX cytochrome complex subunit A n=1 Tax=Hydrogenothermus marinus TaxID=133270 RepID=A0A3M0BGI9_9AQUI|nr:sulfur oxidation c-type cytochrome SoxA [Hydrogenothermus marinus]RMA96137.1 diheme cytochrome SoxA (sulfur oxidation) [Hydrogenothermus marinus]
MRMKKFLMASAIIAASTSMAAEVISPEDWKLYQEGINPGEIFAEEVGGKLFNKPMGPEGKSCASCHTKNGEVEEKVATAAAYYPKYDKSCGKVINLEQRIQLCQAKYQKVKPFSLKSKENVALTTYLYYLAAGTPIKIDLSEPHVKEYHDYGRYVFTLKRGKRNLSCQVCHEFAVGHVLRMQPLYPLGTQTINGSKGKANASLWPAYRMTKDKVFTLQQRFLGCQKQAGQKKLPLGSKEMVALEVYIKSLANGVELKTPGLRR